MKHYLSVILFFSFFYTTAQEEKLEGAWIEYKREVIGDTNQTAYTYNKKRLPFGDSYTFLENGSYLLSNEDDENSYELVQDTLTLLYGTPYQHHCDCNTTPWPQYKFIVSYPEKGKLKLREICDSATLGYEHYFKKRKKLSNVSEPGADHLMQASFPGGPDSLKNFISANLDQELIKHTLSKSFDGVRLFLLIDQNGKIKDAIITGHPLKKYVPEAFRIVRLMPNWIPAINDKGKPVKSHSWLEISFVHN